MSTTLATSPVYATDQYTLTRHVAVDFYVFRGTAYLVTRCGEELPDHQTVNVSRDTAGWWAGCSLCEAPSSPHRLYLDDDDDLQPPQRHTEWSGRVARYLHNLGGHDISCNCADCAD